MERRGALSFKEIKKLFIALIALSLLFSGCKNGGDKRGEQTTPVITYPSPFKGNLRDNRFITVSVRSEKSHSRLITLENGLKVVFKQSSLEKSRLSFYLKNPPLFQNSLNAGAEKIVLRYLKEWIEGEALKLTGLEDTPQGTLIYNNDLSGLSFEFPHSYYRQMVAITAAALRLESLDRARLSELLAEERSRFFVNMKEAEYRLNYRQLNYLFKFNHLSNHFNGNFLSFNTLDGEKINSYYREMFFAERLLFLVSGESIERSSADIEELSALSGISGSIRNSLYESLTSENFEREPRFYEMPVSSEPSPLLLKGLFMAPSFLNDDFFTYQVLLKIIEENLAITQLQENRVLLQSKMVNGINYGELALSLQEGEAIYNLLSLKRELERNIGSTAVYYYMDENEELIREYSSQTMETLITKDIDKPLSRLKREVYLEYNFTDIRNLPKEVKFISTIFLLDDFADNSIIKAKIDSITKEDIDRTALKYLSSICWAIIGPKSELRKISRDFLY